MKHKDLLENLRHGDLKSLVFNAALTPRFCWPTIHLESNNIPTEACFKRFLDGAKQCLVENLVYLNC